MAGLGGELQAAGGGEVEAGGVGDDGRGGAAAEGEVDGPEAVGGAVGADEEGAGDREGVGQGGKIRPDGGADPDEVAAGLACGFAGVDGKAREMGKDGEWGRPAGALGAAIRVGGFGEAEPFVDSVAIEPAAREEGVDGVQGGGDR